MRAAAFCLLVLAPSAAAVELALPAAPAASFSAPAAPLAIPPLSASLSAASVLGSPPSAALPAAAPALSAPVPAPEAAPIAAAAAATFAVVPTAARAAAASDAPGAAADSTAQSADARRLWDGAARFAAAGTDAPLVERLTTGKASPEFVAAVRGRIAASFPPAVLRALLDAGYRVEIDRRLRDAHPELDESHDALSGYHSHEGPNGKLVLIGEETKDADGRWAKSDSWENAVNHELGLALARALGDVEAQRVAAADPTQSGWYRAAGLAESPALREAWRRDTSRMPRELKYEKNPDGLPNFLHYYLKPDDNGWFQTARRLTFAEGLDVLIRGERAVSNHDDFVRYFPNTLAAMRTELAARFDWNLPAPTLNVIDRPRADPALTSAELAERLVTGGASPAFVAKVRAKLAELPAALLRDLIEGGYRIEANRDVRQGRPHLNPDNDYTGGFHSHGDAVRYIVVAEKIKMKASGEWVDSVVWENAVNHEIGHALAYVIGEEEARRTSAPELELWYRKKGISETPEYREAWRLDYQAIPDELKQQWRDRLENMFYYFVHPDPGGWYQRARQETFAEGFDVLLRGPRSSFNYENFTRRFPRALAEQRRMLEARYGPAFPVFPALRAFPAPAP